jgi:hypothetical protein
MRAHATIAAIVLVLVLLVAPVGAQAQTLENSYEPCPIAGDATLVEVSAITCGDAAPVVSALVAQPPEAAATVLSGAGWSPLRARSSEAGDQHDLVALRGLATLHVRRPGAAPDLDGWGAGRELIFARPQIIGGQPAPRGAALCTSAFLVRLSSGRRGGLSAAHCGGLRAKDHSVERHNAALRRQPAPGIVLGRVLRSLVRSQPYDALVVPVPSGPTRPASPVIDRGVNRPPWRVVATAQPSSGRAICMTGRTSGVDQCGHILSSRARSAERSVSRWAGRIVRCTTIEAAPGDSGGPIYTAPAADGTVRAVGITTLIVRTAGDRMCFTPIGPVLKGLHAKLVQASG